MQNNLASRITAQCNFDQLDIAFLEAMNDIGRYGFELYGPLPQRREDHRRPERTTSTEIAKHACTHFGDYLSGKSHDALETLDHQLAAVAFNAMMEFRFLRAARAEKSEKHARLNDICPYCGPTCFKGAAHNVRKEDGAFYIDPAKR